WPRTSPSPSNRSGLLASRARGAGGGHTPRAEVVRRPRRTPRLLSARVHRAASLDRRADLRGPGRPLPVPARSCEQPGRHRVTRKVLNYLTSDCSWISSRHAHCCLLRAELVHRRSLPFVSARKSERVASRGAVASVGGLAKVTRAAHAPGASPT